MPLVTIALFHITGLVLGGAFLFFPVSVFILIVIGLATIILLWQLGRLSPARIVLTTLPLLTGLISYVYSSSWFPADHYTHHVKPDIAQHSVTGRIVSPLDRDRGRTAFTLGVEEMDGVPRSGPIRVSVREELSDIGHGDRLRLSARLFEPRSFRNPGAFDYPAHLARSGIHLTASVKARQGIEVLRSSTGPFRRVQDLRERIRQAFLASTSGPGSAILQAMVLGEEGGLTDDVREQFMAAGVTHILSISGSHLGLVAILCFGLVRAVLFLLPEKQYHRLTILAEPKKLAAWIIVLPVTFYALLAGGQTATLRSLVMILAGVAAIVLDRENSLMNALAVATVAILISGPQAVFDLSFQLSFLSVVSIGWVVTLWQDLAVRRRGFLDGLRNSLVVLLAVSLAATLVTGPIVARSFNQISLAGLFANMVVVPLAGFVVVPLGLFSGIVSLFTSSLPLASLNQFAADGFYAVVVFFSRLPFADFHPPAPSPAVIMAYYGLLFFAARYLRQRLLYAVRPLEFSSRPSAHLRWGMASCGAVLAALLFVPLFSGHRTTLTFIDVGQGDAALLRLSSGEVVLVDGGGTYDNRFDVGGRVVAPFLWNQGVRTIDLAVLSHPHPDHMNGLTTLLGLFPVSEVWVSGSDTHLPGYAAFLDAARQAGTVVREMSAGEGEHTVGAAVLRVIHPLRSFATQGRKAYQQENSRSLVLRIFVGGTTVLLTGDIEGDAEEAIVRSGQDIRSDIVKAPHHGSRHSSTGAFVTATRPAVVVASAGAGNRFGHPAVDAVDRWEQAGATVWRTDEHGAVILYLGARPMTVTAWADLILRRIALDHRDRWGETERKNWKRLAGRMRRAL